MSILWVRIRGSSEEGASDRELQIGRTGTPGALVLAFFREQGPDVRVVVTVADLLAAVQVLRVNESEEAKRNEAGRS